MDSPASSRPLPRRKQSVPSPAPSPDSSTSSNDDDNASDSEKEVEEKTPSPAKTSPGSRVDDGEEEDDNGEEEDDNEEEGEDDNEEEGEDDNGEEEEGDNEEEGEGDNEEEGEEEEEEEEVEEEEEEFEKHGTGPEPGTSVPKPEPVTLSPLAVVGPSSEQERRLELVAVAETPPGLNTESKSKNKWTDAEQLMLLKEMVGYSRRNGDCKISNPYMTNFRTSIEGLPICKFSTYQILEKMKTLKKKHDKPNGFGQGKGVHLNPFDEKMLKLSEKLWGENGKGNDKKRKRADVEDQVDDDDVDNARDGDNAGVNNGNNEQGGFSHRVLFWQDAMVRLAGKKLAWPESFARYRIEAMDDKTRDSTARKWIKGKGDLDSAKVNLSRVEDDCLVALLPP